MLRPLAALLAVALPLFAAPALAADPEPVTPVAPVAPLAQVAVDGVEPLIDPGAGTMERRALRMRLDDLEGAQRARAARVLARPSQQRQRCFTTVCVHWFTDGPDAATRAYVRRVAEVAEGVLATYAGAGYRPPKPDGARGGNGLLDIYLQDLGSQGLYGYCDTDQAPPEAGPWDVSAYCAFDNNYQEFPNHTPLENLQVTAAHELFHAVQFAYDYLEDLWFMEATATWAEDEVFDRVNDNVQYLGTSPLSQPAIPLDKSGGLRVYGGWIFIRYLTERHDESEGGMPTLVRDLWERVDGSLGAPDDYSVRAVGRELAERGGGLRAAWARFAAGNRRPGATYDEGAENHYPAAPVAAAVGLRAGHRSDSISRRLDHLSAATVRFDRADGLAAKTLRLTLALPPTRRGSGAVATIYRTDRRPVTTALTPALAGDGDLVTRVDFGRAVQRVEVTLANAGIDYRCWRRTSWSCQGRPQDDDLRFRVSATALR